jgi:hypothetical protein
MKTGLKKNRKKMGRKCETERKRKVKGKQWTEKGKKLQHMYMK